MKKREANITTKLKLWYHSVAETSGPIEVKHTRGKNTFLMSELKEHQRDWLLAATTEHGCWWKIPDTGFSASPFDVLFYKNAVALVVIAFPTWVVAIHIQDLIIINSPSIDEETALQIAAFKVKLSDL